MRNNVFMLGALLSTGCGPDRVQEYACRGTVVTRVDNRATSQFFYGTYAQTRGQSPVVEAHYPGFDGYMAAYLTFHGQQVALRPAGGLFIPKRPHKSLRVIALENGAFIDWSDSIRRDMRHTVFVTYGDGVFEAQRNQQSGSGIQTTTVRTGLLSGF